MYLPPSLLLRLQDHLHGFALLFSGTNQLDACGALPTSARCLGGSFPKRRGASCYWFGRAAHFSRASTYPAPTSTPPSSAAAEAAAARPAPKRTVVQRANGSHGIRGQLAACLTRAQGLPRSLHLAEFKQGFKKNFLKCFLICF